VATRIESGVVLSVEGGLSLVRLDPPDEEACRRCGLCAASALQAEERRLLRVPSPESLRPGDAVRVEIQEPEPAVAALLVFGLPLVVCAAAAGAGYALALAAGLPAWAGALALAAPALVGCAFAIRAVERRWKARGVFRTRIVDAEPGEEAEGEGKKRDDTN
jgi:positive regulator of sigma E activity